MKKKLLVTLVTVLALVLTACQVSGVSQAKGEAVFSVSDAAADMGAVSNIGLTIDGLRIRSEAGAWTTVNVEQQTFMLLDLRDRAAAELLAQAELAAGTYDRLELQISEAIVFDASGQHEAKIPGNKLQLEGTMEVQADAAATANFDFLADQSLHVTGNGEYIFAPVVLLETRTGVDVQVQSNNEVKVSGGSVSTNVTIGMDVHGNLGAGLRIAPDAVLSLAASGNITQTGGQASVAGTIKAVNTANGTITILTDAGTEVTLQVNKQSNINLGGSILSGLLSLNSQIGSRVEADYDVSTGIITRMQAQANAQANANAQAKTEARTGVRASTNTHANAEATVNGTLAGVNTLSGTITIVSDAGVHLVLNLGADATVIVSGAGSTAANLASSIGSHVTVTYDTQTSTASKIVAQGSLNGSVSVSGTLTSVDTEQETVTVLTDAGNEVTLSVTSETTVSVGSGASASSAVQTTANIIGGATGTVETSATSMADLAANVGSSVTAEVNAQTNTATSIKIGK